MNQMNCKKTISVMAAALMLAGAVSIPALAAENDRLISPAPGGEPALIGSDERITYEYPLEVNGGELDITVPVMVPLRTVAEALGFTVTWNGDGTVSIDSGLMHSTIAIGADSYQAVTSLEGAEGATGPLQLGAAPYVVDGCTYVPLKLFDILLGNGAVTLDGGKIAVNTEADTGAAQIPNPWVALDTLEEAEMAAGFDLVLPENVKAYDEVAYQVLPSCDGNMLEVLCLDGEDRLIIRKAPGTGDIRGVYTSYEQEAVETADGASVTMKWKDGTFSLAVWESNGYTYSVYADTARTSADLLALVKGIR